jgi:hypothetical protein
VAATLFAAIGWLMARAFAKAAFCTMPFEEEEAAAAAARTTLLSIATDCTREALLTNY